MSTRAQLALIACALAAGGCGTGATFPRHAILTGIIVNATSQTTSVTENAIVDTKQGESCAHSFAIPVIWLSFAFSSASAKKATISPNDRVATVDRSSLGVLGVYANSCAVVTPGSPVTPAPEPAPPPTGGNAPTAPVNPTSQPPPSKPITMDASGWPSSVPIADRGTCNFVCVAVQGSSPSGSEKNALSKGLEKHLGALRSCVGGSGKSAAGVVVEFDSAGRGIVNYDFGPRSTHRADCPGSFPPVKNLSGPANATWKCTDYCE